MGYNYQYYGSDSAACSPVDPKYERILNQRELYDALSELWQADTCAPRMRDLWTEENRTLGQCSITAFLCQDIFGGEVRGVLRPGGNYHCFNVIGESEFDLTSEQFGEEKLEYSVYKVQSREEHFAKEEKRLRYELLKSRLDAYLQTLPDISIIVPVYNAEAGLNRCIDSILKQSYRNFELILMDDGSTDQSPAICDSYADQDPRVRVVHKPNSGVSDTRNQAVQMARGKYLQFVDSDDWIMEDATGLLAGMMKEKKCQMVIADFYRVIGERVSQKGCITREGLLTTEEFAAEMLQNPADFYYGVLWNKLYDRRIIVDRQVRMDPAISWCEDFIFNLTYLKNCRSIYVLKVPVYYYVKTKGSLVSQNFSIRSSIEMKQMVFRYYNSFYREVLGDEEYENHRFQVYRFLIDISGDGDTLPAVFPGSCRLGKERSNISEEALSGEGFFFDTYRETKLQDRLFEIIALRNDLTLDEVKVLYYLSQSGGVCNTEDACRILGIGRAALGLSLRRLQADGMIEAVKEKDKERDADKDSKEAQKKTYLLLFEAENILSETLFLMHDYEEIQYEGFTAEERELFEKLNARRNRNIRSLL